MTHLGKQPRKKKSSIPIHPTVLILHSEELLLSLITLSPSSQKNKNKKIIWPCSYQHQSLLSCCYFLLPVFWQVMSTLAPFGGSGMNSGLVV